MLDLALARDHGQSCSLLATGRVETRLKALIGKIRLFDIFVVSTGADLDWLLELGRRVGSPCYAKHTFPLALKYIVGLPIPGDVMSWTPRVIIASPCEDFVFSPISVIDVVRWPFDLALRAGNVRGPHRVHASRGKTTAVQKSASQAVTRPCLATRGDNEVQSSKWLS